MCVPVMVWASGHFLGGHDAPLHLFTAYVLELDGGVADVKVVLEQMIQLLQDAGTLRGRNVGDGHVAGHGTGLRPEAPYVEVMDIDDAFNLFHAGTNGGE